METVIVENAWPCGCGFEGPERHMPLDCPAHVDMDPEQAAIDNEVALIEEERRKDLEVEARNRLKVRKGQEES